MARARSLTRSRASLGGSSGVDEVPGSGAAAPGRILFVTGRLAEPALNRTLSEMAPSFAYEVASLKITVAALMTTPWIAKSLEVPPGTELVADPGTLRGGHGGDRRQGWRAGREGSQGPA